MARRSRRRGGEGGVGETSNNIFQLSRQHLNIPYQPTEILSEGQLETIHQASLKILKEIQLIFHGVFCGMHPFPEGIPHLKEVGIDFLLPQA